MKKKIHSFLFFIFVYSLLLFEKNLSIYQSLYLSIIIFTGREYIRGTPSIIKIQILIKLQAIELRTLDEIKWKQSETLPSLLRHSALFIQLQT